MLKKMKAIMVQASIIVLLRNLRLYILFYLENYIKMIDISRKLIY